MDGEDPPAPRSIRRADIDQLVEPAGAKQRRVDQRRPVGRADDDDVLELLQPVHLGQDGVDHALGHLRLAKPAAARRDQAVELVDEDDRRRDLSRAAEQPGDLLLAFAIPFAQQVGGFGGDEIGLALARRGLGEQGFAGPRRAVEQEALGRPDAEPAEGLGMLERQLDAFLQALGGFVEAADIVPANLRRLDHHFAHRRGLDALQRIVEIPELDRQLVEHFGRNRLLLEIELRHDPPNRLERGLAGQRGQVGADEAVGSPRQIIEVDIGAERHAAGMDAEDFAAAGLVGNADDDLAVEPAGPAQRFVERLGPVGGGDDHGVLPRLDAVEQRQELGDQPLFGFAGHLPALGRDRNRSRR